MGDCVYSLSVPFLEGPLLFHPQKTYRFGSLITSSVLNFLPLFILNCTYNGTAVSYLIRRRFLDYSLNILLPCLSEVGSVCAQWTRNLRCYPMRNASRCRFGIYILANILSCHVAGKRDNNEPVLSF